MTNGLILILCSSALARQADTEPRRTVTVLPRYMTDIPQAIPDEIKVPDAAKTARDIRCFSSFTSNSAMTDVVRRCGIPDEHQGSGIYIFLYVMQDGSVVAAGTGNLKRLLYVDHISTGHSTSLLRKVHAPVK